MAADAVGSGQLLHVDDNGDEVAQSGLVQHGAFRLARRARRVDHIGQTVGVGEVDSPRGSGLGHRCHEVVDEERAGLGGIEITLGLLGGQHLVRGDEHLGL